MSLDRHDIVSNEAHLKQYWLPLADLPNLDLRPFVVRDAVASGSYLTDRHLIQLPD